MPLIYEPLNRYETNMCCTMAQGAALLESLDTDNVKLLADLFHMNIEEADLHQTLRQNAGRYHHVHLADSNRKLPGQGHMPYPDLFRTLRETGFDGAAALECGIMGDPREELPRCRERMAGWWG